VPSHRESHRAPIYRGLPREIAKQRFKSEPISSGPAGALRIGHEIKKDMFMLFFPFSFLRENTMEIKIFGFSGVPGLRLPPATEQINPIINSIHDSLFHGCINFARVIFVPM
jgi:hypothetical protein